MNRFRLTLAMLMLAIPLFAEEARKSDGGWVDLLSVETASLDEHWTTTGNWTLKEGVATLTPRPGEKGWSRWTAYLWSKESYGDFEVEFEYRLETKGNSGFYVRVADVNDPVRQGLEVQIYDSASRPDGHQLHDHDSGGIIPGLKPTKNAAKPAGEWNKFRVVHHDDLITVILNGVEVNRLDLSERNDLANRPKVGPIGFQDHALPISLQKIRIKRL